MAITSRVVSESGNTFFVAGPQRERATEAMFYTHFVILLAMRTQNEYFKLGMDAELQEYAQDFTTSWQDYGTTHSKQE
jgi:hypothetical protein